jgi:SulP family sulfate permease
LATWVCRNYSCGNGTLSTHRIFLASTATPSLRRICIDGSAVDDVDFTAAETLRSLHAILQDKGIRLVIAQIMEDVKAESRYTLAQCLATTPSMTPWMM